MSKNTNEALLAEIISAIEEVKGHNITILDLREIDNAVCDYYVITDGTSTTQVKAISRSVEKILGKNLKEKPWHVEGETESEWILLDYSSIAVHVFQKETRERYDIESLWGDAKQTIIETSIN